MRKIQFKGENLRAREEATFFHPDIVAYDAPYRDHPDKERVKAHRVGGSPGGPDTTDGLEISGWGEIRYENIQTFVAWICNQFPDLFKLED